MEAVELDQLYLCELEAPALEEFESTLESQVERMHRAAQDKADRAAELGDTVERLRRTVARLEAEREAQAELLEELREDAFALRQQASTREADLSDQRRLVAELQSELEAAGRASDALQERLRDTRKQSLERLATQRKEHQAALEEAAGTRRSEVWLSTSPMQLDSDGPPTVPFVGPAVAAAAHGAVPPGLPPHAKRKTCQ